MENASTRKSEDWPQDRKEQIEMAREVFAEDLVTEVRDIPLKNVFDRLINSDAKLSQEEQDISDWLTSMSEDDIGKMKTFAEYILDSSLFRLLAMLDGAAGGDPLDDSISNYTLALAKYDDEVSLKEVKPAESFPINDPVLDDLHDSYKDWIHRYSKKK